MIAFFLVCHIMSVQFHASAVLEVYNKLYLLVRKTSLPVLEDQKF